MIAGKDSTWYPTRRSRRTGYFRWGVAKLVKAPDFDSGIRGFESFLPSPFFSASPDAVVRAKRQTI